MPTSSVKPERQLGLLWGGVALLLILVSPLAEGRATALPSCPIKTLSGLPCPTCGTTRAALALSHFDLTGSMAINPLAALVWLGLIVGGLIVGLRAVLNMPLREPKWVLSIPVRGLLVLVILANWLYLVGVGT